MLYRTQRKLSLLIPTGALLGLSWACSSDSNDDSDTKEDVVSTSDPLVTTTPEAPGENCEAGGVHISVGIDEDGDGRLDDDEVTDDEYVCGARGAAGKPGSEGEPGSEGTPGSQGERGARGEPGEQGSMGNVGGQGPQGEPGPRGDEGPQGAPGGAGPRGPRGYGSLVEVGGEQPDPSCATGWSRTVSVGIDRENGEQPPNGVLDPDEITSTLKLCVVTPQCPEGTHDHDDNPGTPCVTTFTFQSSVTGLFDRPPQGIEASDAVRFSVHFVPQELGTCTPQSIHTACTLPLVSYEISYESGYSQSGTLTSVDLVDGQSEEEDEDYLSFISNGGYIFIVYDSTGQLRETAPTDSSFEVLDSLVGSEAFNFSFFEEVTWITTHNDETSGQGSTIITKTP